MYDYPTPRLTVVVPAKHPWLVEGRKDLVWWTAQDDSRWEARYEGDHLDGVWHVYCESGEYGPDEEDYMVVKATDLLDVIANGAGVCRRADRPILTPEG